MRLRVMLRYLRLSVCGWYCGVVGLLLVHGLFLSLLAQAKPVNDHFTQLAAESGLSVQVPSGYQVLSPKANDIVQYEYAARHRSGTVEIRFIIRPLSRLQIDYQDPHNAAPEPNHLFPLLFESLILAMSKGTQSVSQSEYSQADAGKYFNAGWASAAIFDVDPKFTADYSQALMLAIHKNNQADAYVIFLFNDGQLAKPLIQSAISSLRFST